MADYCYYCMSNIGNGFCTNCGRRNRDIVSLAHQLQPGTLLQDGRYLVGRVLGQGGFGITYLGMDTRLNRKVAIKEYFPTECANRISSITPEITVSTADAEFLREGQRRFLQEAQLLSQFEDTPGIVPIHDFFEENGTAYIVMKFLEGQNMKKTIEQGRISADAAFKLFAPIFDVLEKMHRANIIHRDISPDNVMLQPDGSLVLMDFGAARQVSRDASRSLSVMLKVGYAPAEQYVTRGGTGPWTDIYALCATLYKCITGITPPESVARLLNDIIQWPSELGIAISPEQEATLKTGMAVEAEKRFRNIAALKQALKTPVSPAAYPESAAAGQYAAGFGEASSLAEPITEESSRSRVNGPLLGAIAAGIAIVVIIAAMVGLVVRVRNRNTAGAGSAGELLEASSAEVTAISAEEENEVLTAAESDEEVEAEAESEQVTTETPVVTEEPAAEAASEPEEAQNEDTTIKVGDYITYGSYEQDNDKSNGAEAISWRVLDIQNGKALHISEYGLDAKAYNEECTDITWEDCTLRSWLNNEFLDEAFTASERSAIQLTQVVNDDNAEYGTEGGNDTEDYIFLLSLDEAEQYFADDEDRMCASTAYANANGCYTDSDYKTKAGEACCWWWLRSPGDCTLGAAFVSIGGWLFEYGNIVDDYGDAARPALWLDISNLKS